MQVGQSLSHRTLFDTLKLFGTYSGLKVNHDKMEILLLGNMEINSSELGVNEISKVIKILGVNFTFNHSLFYKLNFESIEKSLRGLLKSWGWRGLTLLGKIQVIKSFAIPKILYRVVLISNKKEFIKKNKHFIVLVNYIVLESKYFIYRCKLNKGSLSLRLLVDKFRKTFQTERFVARKNDKLDFHDKKWKPLLPLIQQ